MDDAVWEGETAGAAEQAPIMTASGTAAATIRADNAIPIWGTLSDSYLCTATGKVLVPI